VQQTQQYGLIGYPLAHSFSPGYFAEKFLREGINAEYTPFPLPTIQDFPRLLTANPGIRGLNVTIPYKQAVIPYMDDMDDAAKMISAVNCIDIRNGTIKGYNTDVTGFEQSLKPLLQQQHTNALILGTGGASLAVKYVLGKLGIAFKTISRKRGDSVWSYDDISAEIIAGHTLIINTTPLGMHPHPDAYPHLPYKAINSSHLLYDLIYNPAETQFLSLGKAQGATIKNGLEMLHLQAEASWHIWNS
jgi:shikimate dehydrogenase